MEAVFLAIRGVKERQKKPKPTTIPMKLSLLAKIGCGEGKTVTNKKKDRGMRDAEANAILAQMIPQEVAEYSLTRPLLSVQTARVVEKMRKYWFIRREGFFSHTADPKRTFATAVRIRIGKYSLIAF